MIAIPASMWVELPGELVKLIAQQKSLRCGTMRQVCKAWRTALVPSFTELEPYLQRVPRETLAPLMAAAWQDSPGALRAALISACAPVWIEHTVEDVGEITERGVALKELDFQGQRKLVANLSISVRAGRGRDFYNVEMWDAVAQQCAEQSAEYLQQQHLSSGGH